MRRHSGTDIPCDCLMLHSAQCWLAPCVEVLAQVQASILQKHKTHADSGYGYPRHRHMYGHAGINLVGLDGTLYDQVLDTIFYLGLAPARFSVSPSLCNPHLIPQKGSFQGAGQLCI